MSDTTYALLDGEELDYTGGVDIKGKGRRDTYIWPRESSHLRNMALYSARVVATTRLQSLLSGSSRTAPPSVPCSVPNPGLDPYDSTPLPHLGGNGDDGGSREKFLPPPPLRWSHAPQGTPATATARLRQMLLRRLTLSGLQGQQQPEGGRPGSQADHDRRSVPNDLSRQYASLPLPPPLAQPSERLTPPHLPFTLTEYVELRSASWNGYLAG